MKKILMIFVLGIAAGALAFGQQVQSVRGTVTSSSDGLGVTGVMISVPGTTVGTMSDADGNYTLNVLCRRQYACIQLCGYEES
ncbi:MAG: carboxypeptidase-like regulatory domain-containing protein [Bacteroidales bacterium]|nr:carboxypeptidase-like regulatory domain-containing protein [Bacteroidales bacterium]